MSEMESFEKKCVVQNIQTNKNIRYPLKILSSSQEFIDKLKYLALTLKIWG